MDPYQQYQAPQPGNYQFILNPEKPPRRGFSFGGGNLAVTIGVLVGGTLILMLFLVIIINAFTGGGSKAGLVELTKTQNELVRVAEQGSIGATQQTTKNLASTIDLSMMSHQQGTLQYLAEKGVKVNPKDLKLKQNAVTDQQLASAKATSTFDAAFAEIMQQQLDAYAATLKQLHGASKSKSERELISDYYAQAQLLISQVPYAQERIQSTGQ